jgi:prepilin-type N-terminal cleavage/methylation domain-containing protein
MKSVSIVSSKAFSLVEILIVVAIIGILAGIAIPQMNVSDDARATVAQRNLDDINTAVESYRQLTGVSLFAGLLNPTANEISTRIESLKSPRADIGPLRGMGLERRPLLSGSFRFSYVNTDQVLDSHRGVWNGSRFVLLKPKVSNTIGGGEINLE